MKPSSVLLLALSANASAYGSQQVISSLNLAGSSYQCDNGAKPSIACSDPSSEKHNCSCSCTNGIKFDQPLDPFSSAAIGGSNPALGNDSKCQADKDFCLKHEQELMAKVGELTDGQVQHVKREQELLDQLNTYQKKTYTYLGCFSDTSNRVLKDKTTSAADMTVEKCESTCQGYKYYGLQWTKECYCGNTFAIPTQSKAEATCNMPCGGNKDQKCGGSLTNSVYVKIN